jgi:hypothetical protein
MRSLIINHINLKYLALIQIFQQDMLGLLRSEVMYCIHKDKHKDYLPWQMALGEPRAHD